MTTVYLAGGEDSEFYLSGAGDVTTTAGKFRSTYARCALRSGVPSVTLAAGAWQNRNPFSASDFWFSVRHIVDSGSLNNTNDAGFISFRDSGNITRLALLGTGTSNTFKFCKLNAAGTVTQLGSNFSIILGTSAIVKLDFHIFDNASGTVDIYADGIRVFTYSGDTTTDGVSTIAYVRLLGMVNTTLGTGQSDWSEIMVLDVDTRSLNLQTLAPVANGNTHNFDTGSPSAANVNETTLNDATLDGSTTAGQIDEYTIPSIASGTYGILAVGVSARMQKGASGPSQADLVVRSAGSDYFSSDQSLTTTWALYQNWWYTDPATSAAWLSLPNNIGVKSVT